MCIDFLMEESNVAAVYLAKDVSADTSQFLGSIAIPSGEERGNKLRESLRSSIVQSCLPKEEKGGFVFLMPSGWELNPSLEKSIQIKEILCAGRVIKIRVKDKLPRLGIVLRANGTERPLGCINIPNLACKVTELRTQLLKQHPIIYKGLNECGFQFLDCNGWPISHDQEEDLSTLRAVTDNTVRLRAALTPPAVQSPVQGSQGTEAAKINDGKHEQDWLCLTPSPVPRAPTPSRHSLPRVTLKPFDIMVSYVHKETSKFANLLCDELRRLNFSVFIDVQYIKPGIDWQDVLNEAVYNCSLFVPLISAHYGLTEWTNKEVKLADTLEKFIIPISFLPVWPPMCLAIQFATTQYISWGKNAPNMDPRTIASKAAAEISERYDIVKEMKREMEEEETRQAEEMEAEEKDKEGEVPNTTATSSAKKPPKSFSAVIRKSFLKKDFSNSLVVITYHAKQVELIENIQTHLEGRGYEVWASSAGTDPQKRQLFKKKVNEGGVVVFILSQDFASAEWCEQEVYYCEGRKRIIPVIVESIDMPCWMSTLIGTETFLDSRSNSFLDSLTEEVECATQPGKVEGRLRKLVEQKTQLHRMCNDLQSSLPVGRLVYITGGTKFYSRNGEAICREVGRFLAKDRSIVLVTGGFYGVGETVGRSFYDERKSLGWEEGVIHVQAVRDEQDRTLQTRQNKDGTFKPVPYGKTVFIGSSVRQREMLTAKVLDVCILVEGGPGAAFEAHQFSWNDHTVVPIRITGGAASGKFNIPSTIFLKPENVNETDWEILQDEKASPVDIAKSIARIVTVMKS